MGDNNEDYGEDGGVLSNVNPGERVRNLVNRDGDGASMMQGASMNMPESPGPAVMGNTPVIGMVRRERGMPVVRDQLPDLLN